MELQFLQKAAKQQRQQTAAIIVEQNYSDGIFVEEMPSDAPQSGILPLCKC